MRLLKTVVIIGVLVVIASCQTFQQAGTVSAMKSIDSMSFTPLSPGQYKITGPYVATSVVSIKDGALDGSTDTHLYGVVGDGMFLRVASVIPSIYVQVYSGGFSSQNSMGDPENVATMNAMYEIITKANADGADYLFLPRVQKKVFNEGTITKCEVTVYSKGIRILGKE